MKIGALTLSFPSRQFAAKTAETARKNLYSIFKKCEKGWSYVGRAFRITQFSLGASVIRGEAPVVKTIQVFKFISGIGIPFSLAKLATTAQSIIKSIRDRDIEGGTLGGLTVAVLSMELIDSIGTIVNTSLAVAAQAAVQFFSVVSMPMSLTVVGIGTITRTYQLIKTTLVFTRLKGAQKVPDLKEYLQKALEKRSELERHTPPNTVQKFERLLAMLEKKRLQARGASLAYGRDLQRL